MANQFKESLIYRYMCVTGLDDMPDEFSSDVPSFIGSVFDLLAVFCLGFVMRSR